jgi:hypothetical protein
MHCPDCDPNVGLLKLVTQYPQSEVSVGDSVRIEAAVRPITGARRGAPSGLGCEAVFGEPIADRIEWHVADSATVELSPVVSESDGLRSVVWAKPIRSMGGFTHVVIQAFAAEHDLHGGLSLTILPEPAPSAARPR